MFFAGETITHVFVIPFGYLEIDNVVVSYKQNEAIILEKTITSGFIEEEAKVCKFEVPFSQEESLLFSDNDKFTIQLNVYTKNGTRHASHELTSTSGVQYLREPITGAPFSLIESPVDAEIIDYGYDATFTVVAQGVSRYEWQYQVDNGSWTVMPDEQKDILTVTGTEEVVNHYKYRCVLYANDNSGRTITTDPPVKVIVKEAGV